MVQTSDNHKSIAKNTLFMYIRMVITMAITLYTSRVILATLGVEDYGIYNMIASLIVLFSFIKGALSSATQRYLNISLGRNDFVRLKNIFQTSLSVHFIISCFAFIIGELLCYFLVFKILSLPDGRQNAAFWVYQFSLLVFCSGLMRCPFEADIIAHENFNFYAYLGILESVCKLLIVFVLQVVEFDKLILYAILFFLSDFIYLLIFGYYGRKSFSECRIGFKLEKSLGREFLVFSGWSMFGNISYLIASSGINLLFNLFYGVVVNAAYGVANQVNNALNNLIVGFKTAYVPQITKKYAQAKWEDLYELIFQTSKIGLLLFIVPATIIIVNIDAVLSLWLVEVPPHTGSFCVVILLCTLVDSFTNPYFYSIQATGNIKSYQIATSLSFLLDVVISFCFVIYKVNIDLIFWSRFLTRGILNMFIGWYFMKKRINFPVSKYILKCFVPICLYCLFVIVTAQFLYNQLTLLGLKFIVTSAYIVFVSVIGGFIILSSKERKFVQQLIKSRIKR